MKENNPSRQVAAPIPPLYTNQDDEIDLKELFIVLRQEKWTIITCTMIFSIGAIIYALMAQEWWSSQAQITLPQAQDFSEYQMQVKQFQPVFDHYQDDGSMLISEALDSLVDNENLFTSFITEFNSNINKRLFLENNALFQSIKSKFDTDTDTDTDTKERVNRLYSEWFSKIKATQADKTREDIFNLTFQATTKSNSYNMLNGYIAYVSNVVHRNQLMNLQVTITSKRNELLQYQNILTQQTKQLLNIEIQRAGYALQIAKAANVSKPIENLGGNEIFAINLGSTAIEEKIKALKTVDNLSVIEPKLQQLKSKLVLIQNTKINNNVHFKSFRYLETAQLPLDRDKPKRALIALLGTLLGGMLGVAIVLVRLFFRK